MRSNKQNRESAVSVSAVRCSVAKLGLSPGGWTATNVRRRLMPPKAILEKLLDKLEGKP